MSSITSIGLLAISVPLFYLSPIDCDRNPLVSFVFGPGSIKGIACSIRRVLRDEISKIFPISPHPWPHLICSCVSRQVSYGIIPLLLSTYPGRKLSVGFLFLLRQTRS